MLEKNFSYAIEIIIVNNWILNRETTKKAISQLQHRLQIIVNITNKLSFIGKIIIIIKNELKHFPVTNSKGVIIKTVKNGKKRENKIKTSKTSRSYYNSFAYGVVLWIDCFFEYHS